MSLQLKENKKLDLKVPKFNCDDNPLGEHLNEYEMLSHLNCFGFTGIIGRPASGKTSLLVSFLTGKKDSRVFRKVFDNVFVVMPTSSRNSMVKNPFDKHHEEKMFDDLDYDTIESIYKKLKASSAEKETSLLILDDVGASLKNNDIQQLFRKIIYNRRHLKVHVIVLLQSFLSVPKEIRKIFTNIIMFKPSKVEFQNLFDELFETKKDLAIDVMKFVYDKKHEYLFLNVETQKMYKNFDEIIFPTEE
jgi:AAA+ ATPase superfamily predicted ATPase